MNTYNTYDFNPETPFIPLKGCECECDCNVDIDVSTIVDAINDNLCNKFSQTNHHIEHSTERIIDEIRDNKTEICLCNVASKEDIKNAINEINEHTDEKFNEIDFINQFENLNNQLNSIIKNGE